MPFEKGGGKGGSLPACVSRSSLYSPHSSFYNKARGAKYDYTQRLNVGGAKFDITSALWNIVGKIDGDMEAIKPGSPQHTCLRPCYTVFRLDLLLQWCAHVRTWMCVCICLCLRQRKKGFFSSSSICCFFFFFCLFFLLVMPLKFKFVL